MRMIRLVIIKYKPINKEYEIHTWMGKITNRDKVICCYF